MNAGTIQRSLQRMAREIVERVHACGASPADLAVLGIGSGGGHLAGRLRQEIAAATGEVPASGALDIDATGAIPPDGGPPALGKVVVLVADVLHTGRTVHTALAALVGAGGPRRVWLAALVDRGGRELPLATDFVGACVELGEDRGIEVRLREDGAAEDQVIVRPAGGRPTAEART